MWSRYSFVIAICSSVIKDWDRLWWQILERSYICVIHNWKSQVMVPMKFSQNFIVKWCLLETSGINLKTAVLGISKYFQPRIWFAIINFDHFYALLIEFFSTFYVLSWYSLVSDCNQSLVDSLFTLSEANQQSSRNNFMFNGNTL